LKNQSKKHIFENQLDNLDSISFDRIGHVIDVFGYPSKEIVGESNSIPFYILSFAPLQ
jgi:hypothetical protein